MKHLKVTLIVVLLGASCCAAFAQDVAALITQIQSQDEAKRMAAVDALSSAGAPAVQPLFALLEGPNHDANVAARLATDRIVYRASAPGAKDRAAVAAALAQVASSPGRPEVRRHALRMVSFVGREEVAAILARLLRDPEVREMARWALVRIPGQAAVAALADALPAASGEFKAGLINALGTRAEKGAVPALRAALDDKDEAVRVAAMQALARIPEPSSEPLLKKSLAAGSGRVRTAASDAYLRLADTLLAAGRSDVAGRMYESRFREASLEQERCAALGGLAKARGERAVPALLDALDGREPALAGVAASALATVRGGKATQMIAAALEPSRPEVRVHLLAILGQRRDAAALPALLAAAKPGRDIKEREAALQAMGEIGSPEAIPTLASAAASREQPVRTAAVTALSQMPGRAATKAIAAAVPSAAVNVRAVLVGVLGYRRDRQATPAVIAAMKDNSSAVRLAALQAAGALADAAAVPQLLGALRSGDAKERAAAEAALGRMREEKAQRAMVAALEGAPEMMKATLLRALGQRADPRLMPLYVSAAKDRSDPVAAAAVKALGMLRNEKAGPLFIEAAKTRSPEVATMAVRGYLMLGEGVLDKDREHAVEMVRRGLGASASDDDRRLALRAVVHLQDAGSLPLVLPLLSNEEVGEEAGRAVAAIADGLKATDKDKAVGLYREVLGRTHDPDLMRDSVRKLRDLGVDVDPAADAGFVSYWWVIGPFRGLKRLKTEDPIPTGAPIDPSRSLDADGKTFTWRPVHVDDPLGMLNLNREVAEMSDCGAYMYAEVMSDAARDVLLKIGSDDGVVCWLNGKQVHAFWGGRGYAPDQDVVQTGLKAGTNTLLLKVVNEGGDWGAGVRITDSASKPLLLKQRKP